MIRANVTVTGKITKSAQIRTDKNGKPYLSFVVTLVLQDAKTKQKSVDIVVTDVNGTQNDLSRYVEKKRAEVKGELRIKKKGEDFVFYLGATEISMKDVSGIDNLSGQMEFIGHLGSKGAEEWKDKNGKPFAAFSARSTEKINDDTYVDTWVDFIKFPSKDKEQESEALIPDWLVPKSKVRIKGDLQVKSYNDKLRFSSRVVDCSPYVPSQQ